LMGSFVLAVGLWLRFDPETVSLLNGDKAPDTFFIGVYILIGAGSLVMLVGFFGCCGAVRESQCLLGSVSAYKQRTFQCYYVISLHHLFCFFPIFVVFCLSANHFWCRGGSRSVWILEQGQGIKDFFNNKLYIIGYVGIGIAGVMIIGMIFSMVLCCAIRNSREVI
ncbi:unnamed protein product, partial [Tetraodon nigroviridis]